MISTYFKSPFALRRFAASTVGEYLDAFSESLATDGYSRHVVRKLLPAAVHLGDWSHRLKVSVSSFDDDLLRRFRRHLPRCRCGWRRHGRLASAARGAELFLSFLRRAAVVPPPKAEAVPFEETMACFRLWLLRRRGLAATTVHLYESHLRPFLEALGDDATTYQPAAIQSFVIQHLGQRGHNVARTLSIALRAYLRSLVAAGGVAASLVHCVPTVRQWRLSSLPRYLPAPDVERVISSCDASTPKGLRDRAALLLLARLGLRAGDIVRMTIDDIDWTRGTLKVRGKGRRETLLPLPQDAGDALLLYLERGRPRVPIERMFLTAKAPIRPFTTSVAVSLLVRAALTRAGIADPPSRGAHLLRHSAATTMLRSGNSLDTISAVLRHRASDSTAHYAKVDIGMLAQVAQPWPGGTSC